MLQAPGCCADRGKVTRLAAPQLGGGWVRTNDSTRPAQSEMEMAVAESLDQIVTAQGPAAVAEGHPTPAKRRARRSPRRSRHAENQLRGPSSLACPEARWLSRCHYCADPHITSIEMTLTDGSQVRFGSCHRCERHWWEQDGRLLSFEHVIAKSRKIA